MTLPRGLRVASRFRQKAVALICWCGLTVGVCFVVVALGVSVYRTYFLKHSARTTGIVVALIQEDGGPESGLLFCPRFRFTDKVGQSHTVEGQTCSHPAEFNIGDQVIVRYWIADPEDASIEPFYQLWFMPTMFGAFAVLLLSVGFLSRAYAQRHHLSLSLFDFWS